MPQLRVQSLVKTFRGGVTAVDDLSFEVGDREFVFLLGPSGAGKTTTLRMIAGVEQPTAGSISLAGRDVIGLSPRQRNVAMVFDKHSLYPHLSVFENMAYPLRRVSMPHADMERRIGEVADILQIRALLDRQPRALSGGQQQRVAIGRMLVRSADIYLLDEPISHLDAKLRAHMRVEFKRLQKEFAATILYVSHDQLEAMTMGDRIVVINEGRVQQIGTPRQIFDRPANLFVASFVGQPAMNVLPGRLVQEDGTWRLNGEAFSAEVDRRAIAASALAQRPARPLKLGIRPHRVTIAEPGGTGPNLAGGTVYAVEKLGSETVFDIDIGGQIVRAWTRNAQIGRSARRIGDTARIHLDPAAIHLFDAETGETLAQPEASTLPAA